MIEYEKVCRDSPPDWIVVVGDVNSTLACALVGTKLLIPVAHLEAGLRSGDRTMPEEINRLATDAIARSVVDAVAATPTSTCAAKGVAPEKIERVGNIMIDSFELMAPKIRAAGVAKKLGLEPGRYGVVTLHRPSNVDTPETLGLIVDELVARRRALPLVFPVHPRTRERLSDFGLRREARRGAGHPAPRAAGLYRVHEPGRAIARIALTDSGGVQEETSYLGIPCLTLRENTERPVTVTLGTNRLVRAAGLNEKVDEILRRTRATAPTIPLWDGATAGRVAESLRRASRARL